MADEAGGSEETASEESEVVEEEAGSESASDEVETSEVESEAEPAPADDQAEEEEPEVTPKSNKEALIAGMTPAAKAEYFQAKSALKQLSQENRALKERFAAVEREMASRRKRPEPVQEEEEPEVSPDLQALNAHVTALEKELATQPNREASFVERLRKADRDTARIEYDLERADEFEKPSLQNRLDMAQFRLDAAIKEYQQFQTRTQGLPQEIARAKREIGRATQEAESQRVRQQRAEADRQRTYETFPKEVDTLRNKHFAAYLPKNEKLASSKGPTARLVDALLSMDMWRAGHIGGLAQEQVDVEGLVKGHLALLKEFGEEYARSRMNKVSRGQAASQPANGVTKPRTPGQPATPGKPQQPYDMATDPKLSKSRRLLMAAFERPAVVPAKPGSR